MIIFPAIDLQGGKCVRLQQGDMNRATLFNDDPAAQAKQFAEQGFSYLHVIDLDGAFAGRSVNSDAIEAILAATSLPVQLGGGIRDMQMIENWLAKGVARIILGTAAAKNPDFVRLACRQFPGRIGIGIDARNGRVALSGWAEESDIEASDLARQFEDAGATVLIRTDIERDGLLTGINVAATQVLAEAVRVPVIASGGLSGLSDIKKLQKLEQKGIIGVIAGRALYDGRLDAAEVLALDGVT